MKRVRADVVQTTNQKQVPDHSSLMGDVVRCRARNAGGGRRKPPPPSRPQVALRPDAEQRPGATAFGDGKLRQSQWRARR
jgi:hypothetical protein